MNLGYKKRPRWERTRRIEILRCAQNDTVMTRGQVGFTLIELLVVMGVIAILLSILAPAVSSVRDKVRQVRNINNQGLIVEAMNYYAAERKNRYPGSVATIGYRNGNWNFRGPGQTITWPEVAYPRGTYRSLSSYLYRYINDPEVMFCPNAPEEYAYIEEAWNDWGKEPREVDRKQPEQVEDYRRTLVGSYCFYQNYRGYLAENNRYFEGPRRPDVGKGFSKVLVSDCFGYNDQGMITGQSDRDTKDASSNYSIYSCERFPKARKQKQGYSKVPFWVREGARTATDGEVRLHAGFVDGHVGSYYVGEATSMTILSGIGGTLPWGDLNKYGGVLLPPLGDMY